MLIKIQRSQRQKTGFFGGDKGVFFNLAVRAEYTPQEQADIRKYQLGGSQVFAADIKDKGKERSVYITVDSLAAGHSIECWNIGELQQIENEVIAACRQLQVYLDVAESFDGREILVDLNKTDAAAAG